MARQTIQEGIGCPIVALPQIPEQRRNRGEEDHVIERQLLGQLMQQPTADHLGREDGGKTVPPLVTQHGIIEDARRVEDPLEWSFTSGELGKKGAHRRFIGHIDRGKLHGDALRRQAVDRRLLIVRSNPPPPGEEKLGGTLGGQPFGHQQPQRPQAPGDQIGRIVTNAHQGLAFS